MTYKRVPYTFLVTREWAFLLCVKREWGFIFSVTRESIFFRPRETGFRFFRDPWNMHLLSRDFWTNDFCRNSFSLFLEILASLKLVNYTKLDVKPANSMSLRIEDWELTTATATLRDWNPQSLTRVLGQICTIGVSLRTRQTRIQPLLLPGISEVWFSTLYRRGGEK